MYIHRHYRLEPPSGKSKQTESVVIPGEQVIVLSKKYTLWQRVSRDDPALVVVPLSFSRRSPWSHSQSVTPCSVCTEVYDLRQCQCSWRSKISGDLHRLLKVQQNQIIQRVENKVSGFEKSTVRKEIL